jgi:hypothetical protein
LAFRAIEQAYPDVPVLNETFNRSTRRVVGQLRTEGYHVSFDLGGFGGPSTGLSGRRRGLHRPIGGGAVAAGLLVGVGQVISPRPAPVRCQQECATNVFPVRDGINDLQVCPVPSVEVPPMP